MREPTRQITWTQRLHAAAAVIASEPPPRVAPSVKERAQECLVCLRPGDVLPGWQVEIIQMLRSRLTRHEVASHGEFDDAFGEAWEAACARSAS